VNPGAVTSSIHVTVRDVVDVLVQKSVAVNVLVCERLHPVLTTGPSLCVIVGTPHASVAVALLNALSMAVGVGLQLRLTGV